MFKTGIWPIINKEGCLSKLVVEKTRQTIWNNESYHVLRFKCDEIKQSILNQIHFFLKYTNLPEAIIAKILNFEFYLSHPNLRPKLNTLIQDMMYEELNKDQ